jgi:hypothetical protein
MDEAIDRGEGHCGIGKDLPPFAEWLVGGDEHGPALVACADQLEQHAGLGLILGDVSEVVEDQQVEAVEPIDCGFEVEFAARDLELLHQIGRAGEENLPSLLDES